MASADEIREQQRQTWDRFSDGWRTWDELMMGMLAPVATTMLGALDLHDDSVHLDVAAGTGEPGLSVAALAPRGRVVITDLSPGMLTTAATTAEARGLTNVEIRECGADDLPFDDGSFDSVTCRFGFMFFPDIPAAVAELVRVLRPGGRLATAVWAEPAGNPWATIPMGAIAAEVEMPAPDPDAPGLFRCAAPGSVAAVMSAAGLRDVAEIEVRSMLNPVDAEQYWDYMTEVAAPVVAGLDRADDATKARIRAATLEQVHAYETDGAPSIPLHSRVVVGTK